MNLRRLKRGSSSATFLGGCLCLPALAGCGFVEGLANSVIRARDIVQIMNSGPALASPASETEEVARIYERALTDAYFDFWTRTPSEPFDAKDARPVATAIWCAGRRLTPTATSPRATYQPCFEKLFAELRLPPPDPSFALLHESQPKPDARRERDVIRVEALLEASVFTTVNFLRSNFPAQLRGAGADDVLPDTPDWRSVQEGVRRGLNLFTAYQVSHAKVATRDRSPTALVLSGGAANGAFSAGGVWFLLHQIAKDPALAAKDHVDMVAAASTGALIGVLVKDFFAGPDRQGPALATLTNSYLCSVASDLYCATDHGVIDLGITGSGGDATGLVRFSGVKRLLDDHIDDRTLRAPVEYFASVTDLTTGRLFDFSSADATDIETVGNLKQAVLASIAEPGMAEPMCRVGGHAGFFVDGGVRSGLPVLAPILGGAEHVVEFVNEQSDLIPLASPPPTALSALFRSLDLFVYQPIVGELGEAEYELATRRAAEYEVCMDRAEARAQAQGKPLAYDEANRFCTYVGKTDHPGPGQRGKAVLHALEPLYQSSQVFQPRQAPNGFEQDVGDIVGLNAAGYTFSPATMWRQFVLGAATVQERCVEIATALGWVTTGFCEGREELKSELQQLRAGLASRGCYGKSTTVTVCASSDPPIDPTCSAPPAAKPAGR